jgi:hypothetical protein
LKYFSDFINSLKNQTFKNYELFLLNQDVEDLTIVLTNLPKEIHYKIENAPYNTYHAKNYEFLINNSKLLNYEILIFGDLDDYFHEERIENIVSNLKDNSFVFHDLKLIDKYNRRFTIPTRFESIFSNEKIINSISEVLDKNFIGMSNSAINLKTLTSEIILEDYLIAIDWAIYSQIILKGGSGKYLPYQLTNYRQHFENLVGGNKISSQIMTKGIKVKISHYSFLISIFPEKLKLIKPLLDDFIDTEKYLLDENDAKRYYKAINRIYNNKKWVWWEFVHSVNSLKNDFNIEI